MNTGAVGCSPVPGSEMPMSACLRLARPVHDAAHDRDVQRLDAGILRRHSGIEVGIQVWMSRASSWNTVEVVRPQPGQAATSGTKVRKPIVCRSSCADLDLDRAVAAGFGGQRKADRVADAVLQQDADGRR